MQEVGGLKGTRGRPQRPHRKGGNFEHDFSPSFTSDKPIIATSTLTPAFPPRRTQKSKHDKRKKKRQRLSNAQRVERASSQGLIHITVTADLLQAGFQHLGHLRRLMSALSTGGAHHGTASLTSAHEQSANLRPCAPVPWTHAFHVWPDHHQLKRDTCHLHNIHQDHLFLIFWSSVVY